MHSNLHRISIIRDSFGYTALLKFFLSVYQQKHVLLFNSELFFTIIFYYNLELFSIFGGSEKILINHILWISLRLISYSLLSFFNFFDATKKILLKFWFFCHEVSTPLINQSKFSFHYKYVLWNISMFRYRLGERNITSFVDVCQSL